MEVTYSWIIYSFLIFGSGILCDRKLERRQAVSSSLGNAVEKFNCSNGVPIETSLVCDGHKDCADGSDETKEVCAPSEYGTNVTTDCGRVYINQGRIDNGQKVLDVTVPWNAGLYRLNTFYSEYELICGGSMISSKLVVSAAVCFWRPGVVSSSIISITDGNYKIAVGKYDKNISIIDNEFTQTMDVEIVYLRKDYYELNDIHYNDIAIVLLKTRVSFSRNVSPVCIDWNGNYNVVNGDQGKVFGWRYSNDRGSWKILLDLSLPYIDRTFCKKIKTHGLQDFVTVDKFCSNCAKGDLLYVGTGFNFFHNDSYYLTGVSTRTYIAPNNWVIAFTDVKYHIQWIRDLYHKHT